MMYPSAMHPASSSISITASSSVDPEDSASMRSEKTESERNETPTLLCKRSLFPKKFPGGAVQFHTNFRKLNKASPDLGLEKFKIFKFLTCRRTCGPFSPAPKSISSGLQRASGKMAAASVVRAGLDVGSGSTKVNACVCVCVNCFTVLLLVSVYCV